MCTFHFSTLLANVPAKKLPAKKLVATAGILSEDAEFQLNTGIKERLGKKTSLQEVSSTTDDIDATRSGIIVIQVYDTYK